jgi:ABC-type transport system substrate-binding protein
LYHHAQNPPGAVAGGVVARRVVARRMVAGSLGQGSLWEGGGYAPSGTEEWKRGHTFDGPPAAAQGDRDKERVVGHKRKDADAAERNALEREIDEAKQYDPEDPLFGLTVEDLSGPRLSRRTVLRLMAAAGVLSALRFAPGLESVAYAQGTAGGHLKAGWAGVGEIRTLDPAQINQVLEFQIASNVLSGLTHINPKLVAEGDLAETWTVTPDGLHYTFKLRQGVTFHNGDPFTADDVLFTYNRSKDPNQSIQANVLEGVASVDKIDDHTVRFNLKAPQASFLVKVLERSSGRAMAIVNQRAIKEMGESNYGLMPVGTGPFKVTAHQLGQGVELAKFEHYYDPARPKLDRVTITPIVEPEPLAAAIEAGDIQIIGGNPPAAELIDRFVANPDLVVSQIPGPGFQSLWVNPWREPMKVTDFNKPFSELVQENGFKVRLALAKAFDRADLIKRALFGRGVPAFGSINPAMGYFYDDAIDGTSEQRFDLTEAKKLLADAGFPDGKGFPTFKLTITPAGRREGQIIADILKRNLGITVELDTKDFPVLIDEFDANNYDLLRVGSGGDYDPDDGLVDWMETTSKFNGPKRDKATESFGYFSDKEVDSLTEQERVQPDLAKRKALVQQANKLTSDKVASIFLYHPLDILVYRKDIVYPAESRIPGLVDLDRVSFA